MDICKALIMDFVRKHESQILLSLKLSFEYYPCVNIMKPMNLSFHKVFRSRKNIKLFALEII